MRWSEPSLTSHRWKNVLAGDAPSPDLFVRSSSLRFCANMSILFSHGNCGNRIIFVFALPFLRFAFSLCLRYLVKGQGRHSMYDPTNHKLSSTLREGDWFLAFGHILVTLTRDKLGNPFISALNPTQGGCADYGFATLPIKVFPASSTALVRHVHSVLRAKLCQNVT